MTAVPVQLLVIAKAPVPGKAKTRLCPPCTPEQAARIAAAALTDTLAAVRATPAVRRTLVWHGPSGGLSGWYVVSQRGDGLGERLAHAFADTAVPGLSSLLVGMDTPQLTPALLTGLVEQLASGADAVLAPALDGGWWALALAEPRHGRVLRDVPMSTADTGALTAAALRGLGLTVLDGPVLRDVDLADDARAVAAQCPGGSFGAAVRDHLPTPSAPSTVTVPAPSGAPVVRVGP